MIKEYRLKHKVILLSNAPGEFLYTILKDNDIYSLFDEIIISSEVKIKKPTAKIFSDTLALMNISPKNTYFIDDNIANVKSAEKIGINAILYKDIGALKTIIDKI